LIIPPLLKPFNFSTFTSQDFWEAWLGMTDGGLATEYENGWLAWEGANLVDQE
jgi:hypothetical protein